MSRRVVLSLLVVVGAAVLPGAAEGADAGRLEPLPKAFAWGVASSAFQSEGGTLDDSWQRTLAAHPTLDRYRRSVDFLHRYRGDIKLADELGADTYRISVNWARVEPRRGQVDPAGVRFYDRVVAAMRARGIDPLITLDHWDYPGWVDDQGGWTNARTARDFVAFARTIAARYHARVHRWLTFNEAWFYRLVETAYQPLTPDEATTMTANLITAHRGAYDVIHRYDRRAQVSSNVFWRDTETLTTDPFLTGVRDKLDYVGLDYYYPGFTGADLNAAVTGTAWNAQIEPFGIYTALRTFHRAFPDLPVMVTENGMPTDDGRRRADGWTRAAALRDTVAWIQRARADGVPVIGYLYWSLTDNYEFGNYRSRFGLYRVDVKTDPALRRRPTDGVAAYRRIIRDRGVPADHRLSRPTQAADCALVVAADRAPCLRAAG